MQPLTKGSFAKFSGNPELFKMLDVKHGEVRNNGVGIVNSVKVTGGKYFEAGYLEEYSGLNREPV